jgi:hypothetical protein
VSVDDSRSTPAIMAGLRRWLDKQLPEAGRLVWALVFVGLGLLIIWFTKTVMGVSGDGLFVAELFVAVLIFLVLTGQIAELTAGGVTAKFRELARGRVEPEVAPTIPVDLEEVFFIEKGSVSDALEKLHARAGVEERRPAILSLTLAGETEYNINAVWAYLNVLARLERFYFVMFVGPDQRLIGYLPYRQITRALRDPDGSGPVEWLITAVNTGDERAVRSFPGMITEAIASSDSNAEALERMARLNLEAMVVVDAEGRPEGVIERNRLASQMVAAMARR